MDVLRFTITIAQCSIVFYAAVTYANPINAICYLRMDRLLAYVTCLGRTPTQAELNGEEYDELPTELVARIYNQTTLEDFQ